jgi:hypothetical protein
VDVDPLIREGILPRHEQIDRDVLAIIESLGGLDCPF